MPALDGFDFSMLCGGFVIILVGFFFVWLLGEAMKGDR